MGYAKLDDRLPYHRKVRAIPPRLVKPCYAIYVASIQFAQAYETDGKIRKEDIGLLLPTATAPTKLEIAALVNCGLWDECLGGWIIHDYLEHNLSADERRAASKGNSSRVAAYRARLRNAEGNALRNGARTPLPTSTTPTPTPTPLHSSPLLSSADSEGLSALRESEKRESRQRFTALVQGVSERIGMPLTADTVTPPRRADAK